MTAVSLAFLDPVAGTAASFDVPGVRDASRVAAFQDSMTRAAASEPILVAQIDPAQAPAVVSDATAVDGGADAGAAARAREALGLEAPAATVPPTGGDMILDGISRLRGVFDAREARLSEIMQSGAVDSRTLMAMQMEVTQFTMLVDISSKLTGKSTAVFETLMKGQ